MLKKKTVYKINKEFKTGLHLQVCNALLISSAETPGRSAFPGFFALKIQGVFPLISRPVIFVRPDLDRQDALAHTCGADKNAQEKTGLFPRDLLDCVHQGKEMSVWNG